MGARSYGPLRSRMPAFLKFSFEFRVPALLACSCQLHYGTMRGGGEVWLVQNAATWGVLLWGGGEL